MAKTVLVTGASRGIGRAIAWGFAREGWQVAVNYCRSKTQAEQLAEELRAFGCNAAAFCADVSSRQQVEEMLLEVHRVLGPVHTLVNNAGIAQQKLFSDITEEDWDNMFAISVKGGYHCAQAVLPDMLRRQEGCIINISSMWGQVGASCEVHYSAAKAAVIGFTKALAKELGPSRIRVNCVAPGVVATEMNAALSPETLEGLRLETPLELIGAGEDIAFAVCFLASEKARFITGQVLAPNGGFVI